MKLINPAHLRLLLPAALLTAAATLGGSAVGDPATACAAPKEWDIEAFDKCITQADLDLVNGKISSAVYEERIRNCCTDSGGVFKPGLPIHVGGCVAPAAAETQPALPGVAPRPGEATQNPAPPPPPFRNPGVVPTVTLAPASPG